MPILASIAACMEDEHAECTVGGMALASSFKDTLGIVRTEVDTDRFIPVLTSDNTGDVVILVKAWNWEYGACVPSASERDELSSKLSALLQPTCQLAVSVDEYYGQRLILYHQGFLKWASSKYSRSCEACIRMIAREASVRLDDERQGQFNFGVFPTGATFLSWGKSEVNDDLCPACCSYHTSNTVPCGACRRLWYCSQQCREAHWTAEHMAVCGRVHNPVAWTADDAAELLAITSE